MKKTLARVPEERLDVRLVARFAERVPALREMRLAFAIAVAMAIVALLATGFGRAPVRELDGFLRLFMGAKR